MKTKFIVITTLALALNSLASSTLANESKKQDANVTLYDRVMVIGTPEGVHDIPGSAHFIGKSTLDKFQYNDINRVLKQVPGVNIQEEEGFGNRPNIGLRGGRSTRSANITLMEDGILIAPAPYSAPDAYFFPRVDRMEAVEIRKGSSSIKFGPRTTTGALNLISSSIPSKSKGDIFLGYGEDNAQRAKLNYGVTAGNVGVVFDLGHEASDGFKTIDAVGGDTGYSIQDGMLKLRVNSDVSSKYFQSLEFKVGATTEDSSETYLGLTNADFRANPFRRYAASQQDNMDADHQQYHIRHYIEPAEDWDVTTTLYRNDFKRNWYKLQSVNGTGINSALSNTGLLSVLKGETAGTLNVRANNREYLSQGIQTNIGGKFEHANLQHQLEVGLRYHYDEEDRLQHEDVYNINTNGVMTLTTAGTAGSKGDLVGSSRAFAGYIQDEITFNNWQLIPGIRYENIQLKSDNQANGQINKNSLEAYVPGIGIGYDLNDEWKLFASIHKGFAPPGPSTNTNQDIEESINYEAGFRTNQNNFSAELIGFFNDYDNLLGKATLATSGDGSNDLFNGGSVEIYGVEASFAYDFGDHINYRDLRFPLRFNYTYTDTEFQSSFTSGFSEWGTVTAGDELPYIPTHQFFVSQGVEDDKWSFNISGKFVDSMRTTAGSGDIPAGEGTDAHFVIDVMGEYELVKNTKAFLSIDNLTDREYIASRRPAGARPGKPQTIMAGLKVAF